MISASRSAWSAAGSTSPTTTTWAGPTSTRSFRPRTAVFGFQFTFNLNHYIAFEAEGLGTRTHTRDHQTDMYIFSWAGSC